MFHSAIPFSIWLEAHSTSAEFNIFKDSKGQQPKTLKGCTQLKDATRCVHKRQVKFQSEPKFEKSPSPPHDEAFEALLEKILESGYYALWFALPWSGAIHSTVSISYNHNDGNIKTFVRKIYIQHSSSSLHITKVLTRPFWAKNSCASDATAL